MTRASRYAIGSVAVAYVDLAGVPGEPPLVGPLAVVPGNTAFNLGFGVSATYVLLLFPTGRLPSPRWRPVAWTSGGALVTVLIAVNLSPGAFAGLRFDNPVVTGGWGPALALERGAVALLGVMAACCAASLIARYRGARGVERQQLKWVAFAATAGGGILVGMAAATVALRPAALEDDVTAAAVFGPVRRRVQAAVDRRFNRTRYDAARTIDAFGGRLRGQPGLAALVRDATAIVASAMQPVSLSVWFAAGGAPSTERAR